MPFTIKLHHVLGGYIWELRQSGYDVCVVCHNVIHDYINGCVYCDRCGGLVHFRQCVRDSDDVCQDCLTTD